MMFQIKNTSVRTDFGLLCFNSVNSSEPNHRPLAGASKDALQVQNFLQAPQGKLQPLHIGQFPPYSDSKGYNQRILEEHEAMICHKKLQNTPNTNTTNIKLATSC